jgi:hypothetical protein
MIKLDTASFMSDSMMVQLFAFQHTAWGCNNCNKVIPVKKGVK